MKGAWLWLLPLLGACTSEPVKIQVDAAAVVSPQALERHFGSPFTLQTDPVEVRQILRDPELFLNKTVKCAGRVARVCQAAGCWLELRPDTVAEGEGLRVPMAGHSFFVPQDVVGRRAVVEGNLAARELPQAELDHLRGEGLKAIGPLFLAATSVVVR